MTPPSLPPIADPFERDGYGSYDTDELEAIIAFTEGRSAYDPDDDE